MRNLLGKRYSYFFVSGSYITELDQMLKCPPDEGDIDKANIRREFTTELMNFSELKWAKYSTYSPFVLRTLLKWIYFVKGVTPADKDCAISFNDVKVPERDKSLISEYFLIRFY